MQATPLTLVLMTCLAAPVLAEGTLTATLDYGSDDAGAADAFFAALDASDGKILRLDLTLMPDADSGEPDFSLVRAGSDPVICGPAEGTFGTIDNLNDQFTLEFQHPAHFHAPATVHIGDRIRFPRHDITCAAGDMDADSTPLHLTGDFIVEIAEIPTAISYTLFPVNP